MRRASCIRSAPSRTIPTPHAFQSPHQLSERYVALALQLHRLVAEWRIQDHLPDEPVPHRPLCQQGACPGAETRPLEPRGHDHAAMVLRREVERPLEQRRPKVCLLEVEGDLHACRCDTERVGVVHVEHQVQRPAAEREAGDVDALEPNVGRSEEHTSELQSQSNLVCRLLLEKKKTETWTCRDVTQLRPQPTTTDNSGKMVHNRD